MKKIALMMLVAIAAIACNKQEEIVPEINVTTTEFTIPVDGSEEEPFRIQFNANVDWTAALKETSEWCSIAPNSGAPGDATINVYALENELEETRSVTLVITAGTVVKEIELTQEAVYIPRISVSPESVTIPLAGGSVTVEVTANLEYQVNVPEDATWLTHTKEGNVLTFTVATANESFSARSAQITFTTALEEVACTATISQEGRAALAWSKIPTLDYSSYESGHPVRLAAYGDKILLANMNKVLVLNPADGSLVQTINLPEGFVCHSLCVDEGGNIIIANNAAYSWAGIDQCEILNVYTVKSLTDTPRLLLKYHTGNIWCSHTGNIRVAGNIDEKACISAIAASSGYYVAWNAENGEVADDANGWDVFVAGTLPYVPGDSNWGSVVPNGTSCADGLWFVGYQGDYSLQFCEDPVEGKAWTSVAPTGNDSNWNTSTVSLLTVGGVNYAVVMTGAFFNYADPYLLILDVTDKTAVKQLAKIDCGMFAERNADWSLVNYVDGGTAGAHNDLLLVATESGIKMYFADSNFNMVGCINIK